LLVFRGEKANKLALLQKKNPEELRVLGPANNRKKLPNTTFEGKTHTVVTENCWEKQPTDGPIPSTRSKKAKRNRISKTGWYLSHNCSCT